MGNENVVHICTQDFSAKEKKERVSLAGKWMELEIILCRIDKLQKDNVTCFSHTWNLGSLGTYMYRHDITRAGDKRKQGKDRRG